MGWEHSVCSGVSPTTEELPSQRAAIPFSSGHGHSTDGPLRNRRTDVVHDPVINVAEHFIRRLIAG
jgi:hypothetical protein